MAETFIGEIRIFAGNFAPLHWSFCYGQLLPTSSYSVLYSLLGTVYGGDGVNNFALPDLRGRIPVHEGAGIGLTTKIQGSKYGIESVTLTENNVEHSHSFMGSLNDVTSNNPGNNVLADTSTTNNKLYEEIDGDEQIEALHPDTVQDSGGGMAHSNMMPYLAINFIIALTGYYPSRT